MAMIKITADNAAAIEAALQAVNGRATTHTFTDASAIIGEAKAAEAELESLGLPKSKRAGARYVAFSHGGGLPSSYRFSAIGTRVTLLRRSGAWYLESVGRFSIHAGRNSYHDRVKLTAAQAEDVTRRFAQQFDVAA